MATTEQLECWATLRNRMAAAMHSRSKAIVAAWADFNEAMPILLADAAELAALRLQLAQARYATAEAQKEAMAEYANEYGEPLCSDRQHGQWVEEVLRIVADGNDFKADWVCPVCHPDVQDAPRPEGS